MNLNFSNIFKSYWIFYFYAWWCIF